MLAYSGRRCGVNLSWRCTAATGQRRLVGVKGGRPCSAGIRSERVEALGAAGRTTWTPVVGLADETSERGRLCSISLVRSSRRQPSTTACPGGDDLPQGGVAAPNCCVAERRSENLGVCQLWKENHRGVKIIPAQIYTGVDNFQDEGFKFTVERGLPEIIIQTANQVNKTFLLPALYSIVARIKIRDQDTLVVRQEFMHNCRLACFRHSEDHMSSVGEDPDIMVNTLNVYLCFISVNERACQHVLNKQSLGICIVPSKAIEEIYDDSSTDMHMKQIFHGLSNESIR